MDVNSNYRPSDAKLPDSSTTIKPVRTVLQLTNQRQNMNLQCRSAELLANYSDLLLRKTNFNRHLTSEQVETKLKNLVST